MANSGCVLNHSLKNPVTSETLLQHVSVMSSCYSYPHGPVSSLKSWKLFNWSRMSLWLWSPMIITVIIIIIITYVKGFGLSACSKPQLHLCLDLPYIFFLLACNLISVLILKIFPFLFCTNVVFSSANRRLISLELGILISCLLSLFGIWSCVSFHWPEVFNFFWCSSFFIFLPHNLYLDHTARNL